MKKFYFLTGILLFFVQSNLKAQELIPTPYFPADTSALTITVNTALGNQGLYGYGDTGVYVHIGLITDSSTSSTDWRYVPFTWGTANPAAAATYIGNNEYQFTIHNIRAFFGVPAAEVIYKVAILFRNASGSLAQRNADGSDMFVSVFSSALGGQFIAPSFQPTYTPIPQPLTETVGDTLPVQFITNKPATITYMVNGNPVNTVNGQESLRALLPIKQSGNYEIFITATDGQTTIKDSFSFYVSAASNFSPLPSGANEGINYLPGDTSVLLVLYAPHKSNVFIVGDFNNWTQSPSYQMNETPDSNYYWIQINSLTPGTEYAYQYIIDDSLQLADYNTEKVLDASVDPSIPATTYPNLRAFPTAASGTLASVFQTGQTPYNWQVTNFPRPAANNLRIYELLVRDFTAAGNWQTLADTLSYLKTLGVNAIEIMPFANFEGASSWGYNPNFYFAPDKVYGPAAAVKQFIDLCHQQGFAVIMDMVLNHSFGSSPMVQMYWDATNGIPASNSPWFSPYYTHDYDVGYQFNDSSNATQTFRERVITYWLTNYHIDGYRFDLATGFTKVNSCNATGGSCNDALWEAYDTTRINIWNALYATEQAASSGSYCILEMFSVNTERAVYANEGMMVWNDMSNNYEQSTMGYNTGWDLSGSASASTGVPQRGLINYQGSHDDERLMYKNEQYGNSSGAYNIEDTATGLLRNEMAAAFWSMIPGPKMVYEFDELGYDYSINWCTDGTINDACRTGPKPPRWDYIQVPGRKHLHDVYASLFQLNAQHPLLAFDSNFTFSLSGAFRSMHLADTSIAVTVLGNFDVVPSLDTVSFAYAGTWYNYVGTDSIIATGTTQSITLNPGQYGVYIYHLNQDTSTKPPPTDSIPVPGVKIYPNPVVNSNSVLAYNLSYADNVTVSVYDIGGRLIGTYNLGSAVAGNYTIPFSQLPLNIGALKNGVYVLKLSSIQKTAHVSFTVLH